MAQTKVVYVSSERIRKQLTKLRTIQNRQNMVDDLIESYGILNHCQLIDPDPCSYDDLLLFHSSDYVDCLKKHNDADETDDVTDELQEFGLAFDCPLLKNIYDFVTTIAGSTLAAVNAILTGAQVAINWNGGWHHAQRDCASGFCYVNDIVIGIQRLRTRFQKILYIDLDVHHGDGVEAAFSFSKYVMTLSFHLHEPGYFPGSGNISEIGLGLGKGYTVNAPYKRDICGEVFTKYFENVSTKVWESFQPNVCIIQCGADVIAGDHLGGTNLLPSDLSSCIRTLLKWNIPKIFLGGGGYNPVNAAKYWTELTATIVDAPIQKDIPDESSFFLDYGPDFVLDVTPRNVIDKNTTQYIEHKVGLIEDNLEQFVRIKHVEE
ncbi:histone deacetylase 8-like [Uranotaenia lowii]|uniref:histone deacetylase 8-like n=1 Tax=Uranotaenia lowii TaxID=190385 RepID=UPI002478E96F|nr:histone deacetylase 8-like [Uranotaenia lowii]